MLIFLIKKYHLENQKNKKQKLFKHSYFKNGEYNIRSKNVISFEIWKYLVNRNSLSVLGITNGSNRYNIKST